ncbi:MAG: hypothetical protein B6D55_03785 [Candidatus Omnitrophica bacterium 4484_70.2]|nr:MAG: hypothetical protein B6D55_03785 [Candidatus Omnitrophica bacterium 4484_70.2]
MKKELIRKGIGVIFLICFLFALSSHYSFALTWQYHGYYSGDIINGLEVGTNRTGDGEKNIQSKQISGAGTLLPSGYPAFKVSFHFEGYTWDSYSFPDTGYYTGYYDVFAVVLSEEGYYWDLSSTDIHPLEDNSALILGYDPLDPVPDVTDSYWGGEKFDDGILDKKDQDVTLIFKTNSLKQYYLTLFLQTRKDEYYPSWGTISNVEVAPIPEPGTLLLLGSGLLGLGGLSFRKRKAKDIKNSAKS